MSRLSRIARQRVALKLAPWLEPAAEHLKLEDGMDPCAYTGKRCKDCGLVDSCAGRTCGYVSRRAIREAHGKPAVSLPASY